MKSSSWSLAAALFLPAACARPPRRPAPRAEIRLPAVVDGDVVYYSDLGPETIDVSGYPAEQKVNYTLFARTCSRCHTLARAVNSPVQSRPYWRFHVARMSFHLRQLGEPPIPPPQEKAILDFLEYDSRVRKIDHKAEFDGLTEGLKRRADEIYQQELDTTSEGGPRL